MKGIKRLLALLTAFMALATCSPALADAALPYDTYNYDYWKSLVFTPAAYVPAGMVQGVSLTWQGEPIGAFRNPQDIFVADDGLIYLADSGNNRIVVLNSAMNEVVNIITGFDNAGTADRFNNPTGLAVSQSNQLYIADSQNRRIVVLNDDGTLARIVENPQSEVLEDGFVFSPLKVAVDYADRIYCVAARMFEGVMVFESSGEFTGFFGTIPVSLTLWEKFWRKIATKEERAKQQLFIPTEFTGIDIDSEGFVYATNVDTTGSQAVRRLNPRGEDVIRKGISDTLGGDLIGGSGNSQYAGASRIVDVVYRDKGIYSLLDSKRGRIFTYDHEGNLLYVFGGLGSQVGTFAMPVAIEYAQDRILALDSQRAAILIFSETKYGALINDAVGLRFDGDESQAVALWQEVLRLDENNELANSGIGKAYLSAGENELAMEYLRRGMNRSYFSVAYKRWRNEILKANLTMILTGVVLVIILVIVFVKVVKPKMKRRGRGAQT